MLQLIDVLENGYWHACSLAYTGSDQARLSEWLRMPGYVVFMLFGAMPIAIAAARTYLERGSSPPATVARIVQ